MKAIVQALVTTAVALAPLAIQEWMGRQWTLPWMIIYGAIVFAAYWFVFQPDGRFLAVRDPVVKMFIKNAIAGGPAGLIRANIYVFRWLPWPGLVPIISYNANTAHADYGKKWPWGRGLCGEVLSTGQYGICRKGRDDPRKYGMKDADIKQTEHVEAAFCVPLKRATRSGSEAGVSSRVCAVLAYDALSPDAADYLQEQHDSLVENTNRKLLEQIRAISLVFLGGEK